MNIGARLAAWISSLIGGSGDEPSNIVFSAVNIEYKGYIYRAKAMERRICIQRLPDGAQIDFSDERSAPQGKLVQEIFDGFEWELIALCKLIEVYEKMAS